MIKKDFLQKSIPAFDVALHEWKNALDNKEHLIALGQQLKHMIEAAHLFGLVEFGERATRLEKQLIRLFSDDRRTEEACRDAVLASTDLLEWSASQLQENIMSPAQKGLSPESIEGSQAALIYLINSNALSAKDTALQLGYFGYDVVVLNGFDQLAGAISQRPPSAVIVDMEYREAVLAKVGQIAHNRKPGLAYFPIAFISTRGSFEARLAAVRAGADCYFIRPVELTALRDQLDALILSRDSHPYRILIISDNAVTSEYYCAVLSDAGMNIQLLYKLTDLFKVLSDYRPELVLMDVSMPACTGADLAKLIRQTNVYLDVPIVFLSEDNDFSRQLDIIRSGVDDFLVKPVDPAHLVCSLSSRAERYRGLRGLIMRDSLTGLYNHSAIKEYLVRELSSSARSNAPLTLAMIDLDFFKKINDNYGHPVGDQVIRALSRLLQQRLRRNDVVGRYGGEEFAVILPATAVESANHVLDQIREAFSKIRHYGNDSEFTATFSVGIADIANHEDANALFRAADAALYEAKRNGRNCVRVR